MTWGFGPRERNPRERACRLDERRGERLQARVEAWGAILTHLTTADVPLTMRAARKARLSMSAVERSGLLGLALPEQWLGARLRLLRAIHRARGAKARQIEARSEWCARSAEARAARIYATDADSFLAEASKGD